MGEVIPPAFRDNPHPTATAADVGIGDNGVAAGTPPARAHGRAHLRATFGSAVDEERIDVNPCRIRHAGRSESVHVTEVLNPAEIKALTETMPARYAAMVTLAAWAALRFGEITE